jgi:hypothetical protein
MTNTPALTNTYKLSLTAKQVYNLLKSKGHTEFSANQITKAHEQGKDFTFLF